MTFIIITIIIILSRQHPPHYRGAGEPRLHRAAAAGEARHQGQHARHGRSHRAHTRVLREVRGCVRGDCNDWPCCRADLVRLLLQRPDTDVNLATYYGTTALTFAIRSGNVAAVGAAANPIYDQYCALHTRCGSCSPTPAST